MTSLERNTIRRLAQWFPTKKPKPYRDSFGRLWKETEGGLLQLIQDGCDDCGCETGTATGTIYDCPQCINTDSPPRLKLSFAGITNGTCTGGCPSLNGDFILTNTMPLNGNPCGWRFSQSGYTTCTGGSGGTILVTAIIGITAGNVTLTTAIAISGPLGIGSTNTISFRKTYSGLSPVDCLGFNNESIPFFQYNLSPPHRCVTDMTPCLVTSILV